MIKTEDEITSGANVLMRAIADREKMRAEFDKEFLQPHYEFDGTVHGIDSTWPGNYKDYHVQCAWEGYQAACASKQKEIDALQAKTNDLVFDRLLDDVPPPPPLMLIGYIQHSALPIDPRGVDSIYIVTEDGFDGCTVPVFVRTNHE